MLRPSVTETLALIISVGAISLTAFNFGRGFEIDRYEQRITDLSNALDKTEQRCLEQDDIIYELEQKIEFLETMDNSGIKIIRMTRGVRNKNPMNIVALSSRNPWLGQVGKDKGHHAIFTSFQHGLRAGYITLKTYYLKRGINTLYGITSRFCEGDAKKYAHFLAVELGIKQGIHHKIDVLAYMPRLMKAMVRYENGYDVFPDSYYIPYHQ